MTAGHEFTLVPVDPDAHATVLHDWMSRNYARFWDMCEATVDDVRAEQRQIKADPHHEAWLGLHTDGPAGHPAFLMERYDPAHSPLRQHYPVEDGDVGMHLLVGPTDTPRHGYTTAVFTAVMDFIFADPKARRVVVEPDVRNAKIHTLNARLGFVSFRTIRLPDKSALLSFCTRTQFDAAARNSRPRTTDPKDPTP